jgi:hypothetical protein
MYKGMRELSKLQTESQYRHEVSPITEEIANKEELLAETPHALCDVCDFSAVSAKAARYFRNEAKIQKTQNRRGM